jgi:hypothetical protein
MLCRRDSVARLRLSLVFLLLSHLVILASLLFAAAAHAGSKSKLPAVEWIKMQNGALIYGADQYGNRIPDFSTAGYSEGDVSIPDVPTRASLDPLPEGDDTPRIQAALDALTKQPLDASGFRGALVLHKGTYRIAGTILLNASGIVLRGEENADHDTAHHDTADQPMLLARGSPHTLIRVGGSGEWQHAGPEVAIIDDYVPVGADTITVEDAHDFHPSDHIIVEWRMSAPWIHAVGMDRIPPRKDGRAITQWQPGMALRFDRRILAVSGKRLTLDAPLTNAMARSDGAMVWRYVFPGRIEHSGIENLYSDGLAFEKSAGFANPDYLTEGDRPTFVGGGYFDSVFVAFDSVENAWMRNVSVTHYTGIAHVEQFARAITIDGISGDHVQTDFTHAPPAAFAIDGQQTLVEHCQITGAFNHVWMTQARVAGPNVFRSCTAKGDRIDAGTHQRWATGTLFENLKIQGPLEIGNRSNLGTGHGWAGANSVVWNCETDGYRIESPPVAYNWAIGNKGTVMPPGDGDAAGQIVSPGKPVEPESLYEEQLRERHAKVSIPKPIANPLQK